MAEIVYGSTTFHEDDQTIESVVSIERYPSVTVVFSETSGGYLYTIFSSRHELISEGLISEGLVNDLDVDIEEEEEEEEEEKAE